mmetsp:Transcript_57896/g.161584  ORF Transcript_57896/g.161584 Transcript_57896/m.161584 type:complete len:263 (-) Transcript_57896:110-898(-)
MGGHGHTVKLLDQDNLRSTAPALLDGQPLRTRLQWYVPPRRCYSRRELLADRCINFIGAAGAWIGAPVLVWASHAAGDAPLKQLGFWMQGLGFVTMFSCSALYHHWSWHWSSVPLLLSLDHLGINMMIMGCYTPYMLRCGFIFLLAFVWALGLVGMLMEGVKLMRRDLQLSSGGTGQWKAFDVAHGALYVVMGWAALPIVPQVAPLLPAAAVYTAVTGGIFFTSGILLLVMEDCEFHLAAWHAFVLVGSLCFYLVSLLQLVG